MVQEITEELLRKRAEHNEGQLSDLKEITLHQYDIEKINDVLGRKCRQLQILYLQNNLIYKMENLHHLKDLRYLNLAVNNITKIENLESNEHLEKLDLTVNYVYDLISVESLQANYNLRELYLIGNPCANYEYYRLFTIGTLEQLRSLDGEPVTKSERILARQSYTEIRRKIQEQQKEKEGEIEKLIEERTKDKKEISEAHEEKQKNQEKTTDGIGETERINDKPNQLPKLTPEEEIEKYGKVMQKNEGKWDFKFFEDGKGNYVLDVPAGKYMSLSYIDVDVNPKYIRVEIKGKILQLRFDQEVEASKAKAERSKTTGHLKITVPILQDQNPLKKY